MDWWKSPVLQGEENDYGDYDYLIEEIPNNKSEWSFFKQRCSSCGKERKVHFCSTYYFRTLDGWDSNEYRECWCCMLKYKIHGKMWKLKRKWKATKYAIGCIAKEKRYGIKDFKWLYKLFLK